MSNRLWDMPLTLQSAGLAGRCPTLRVTQLLVRVTAPDSQLLHAQVGPLECEALPTVICAPDSQPLPP